MKRESGYYWVKAKGEWHICYYYASDIKGNPVMIWKFINHNQVYVDSDLEEISKHRLLPPPDKDLINDDTEEMKAYMKTKEWKDWWRKNKNNLPKF